MKKALLLLTMVLCAGQGAMALDELTLPDLPLKQGGGILTDTPEALDELGSAFASGDFDGDGFEDLAVGIPGEDSKQGAIQVIYGSATGLDLLRQSFIKQSQVGNTSENDDKFGSALAAGDFDNDGYDDLAISAPYEDVVLATTGANVPNAGAVSVVYGSIDGLDLSNADFWTQDSTNVAGVPEANDLFGCALAVGNFDGDQYDDLAVGICGQSEPGAFQSGAVQVFYGTSLGFSTSPSALAYIVQGTLSETTAPEDQDKFGGALAAGKFDGDQYDDLAIGVPGDQVSVGGSGTRVGAAIIVFGKSSRFTTGAHESRYIYLGVTADEDRFGTSLAAGRFNSDAYDDLAVGAPDRKSASGLSRVGFVYVYFGANSRSGVANTVQILAQGVTGVGDTQESFDSFGSSLVAGRHTDGSDLDYLAIGTPGESIGAATAAGAVHVIYPGATGVLAAVNRQFFTQGSAGLGTNEAAEANDSVGRALGAGDFDGDGRADLVIGVPGEDLNTFNSTGMSHVVTFPPLVDPNELLSDGFEVGTTVNWSAECPPTCGEAFQ